MIVPDCIDVRIVEAIIIEGNKLEMNWLKKLLENGIKIRSNSDRSLKIESFLVRLQ